MTANPSVLERLQTPPDAAVALPRVFMLDLMAIVPYYTGYLCEALGDAGATVELGSIRYHLDRTFFERRGLTPHKKVSDLVSGFTFGVNATRRVLKVLECMLTMIRLLVHFGKNRPDAVHVQFLPMLKFGMPFEAWFLRALKGMNIPLVYTVHNLLPQDTGDRHRGTYRNVYKLADALICHNDHTKRQLVAAFEVDSKRVTVIPHGPLLEGEGTSARGPARRRLGLDVDRTLVLWQGILRPYKGVPFLLDAWKRVNQRFPEARLAIAGNCDESSAKQIQAQVRALEIGESVYLDIRFLSVDELADYYVASDVVVYPYSEITTSGSLMTGLSYGRAIVATRLPAFEQTLSHRDNALLVDYGNTEELSCSLCELIDDESLRDQLGAAARRRHCELPQWKEIAQSTLSVYRQVVDAPRTVTESPSASVSELTRLFQQSSHYVFGLLATMAVGFISFPVFTRVFTVADYGLIDYAQKILLLLTAFSKLGMQNSAMRFFDPAAFLEDPEKRRSYYSTMFFGVLAMACLTTILFWFGLKTRAAVIFDAPLVSILGFAAVLIILRALQSILWSFLRVEERTKTYNVTGFLMKAGSVAAVLVLLPLLGASVKTYYTATIAVESLLVLSVAFPLISRNLLDPQYFDGALFRVSFLFGAPLVLQELFGIILDSGDRGLVQYFLGPNALGFYSVAYGLSTYLNTLMIAPLSLAITPIYLRIWRTEGPAKTTDFLSTALDFFLLAAFGVLLVVTLVARDAITILASEKYHGADRLIPLIVAGLLLYTAQIFLNAGLMIHKRTVVMAGVLFVSAAFNFALNWLLLPRLGLQAAALSTFLSYALCTALLAVFAYKVLPLKFHFRSAVTYSGSAFLSWIVLVRLELQTPFANLVVTSAAAALLYLGVIYVLDPRARVTARSVYGTAMGRFR